jgi:tetratricopeptide (TPR) repeat protein
MGLSIIAFACVAGFAYSQEADQAAASTEVETAETVANRAIAELAAWNNKEAKKILRKAKNKYGSTPEFKTAWALLEVQEGADKDPKKVDRGVNNLAKATKMTSFDAVASYFEGEILYQNDQRDEARVAWQTAAERAAELVAADKNDPTAQFYLGAASIRLKEFGDARKALRVALRKDFDPAMVHHQIGLSFLFQKQWSKAKKEFDKGLEIRPGYAPMYFWRAMAWDKLGRKDNLLIDLDQYVKLAPNGPEAGKARAVLASAGG